MKREQTIILIQGVITIAALAFAVGVTRTPAHSDTFTIDHLQNTSQMVSLLNLDPPQAQQLQVLNTSLRETLQKTCHRNCAARQEIVHADDTEPETKEKMLKKMREAYEDGERATLQHIQAVRAILDRQQRETFDELLSRCLCGGCEHSH